VAASVSEWSFLSSLVAASVSEWGFPFFPCGREREPLDLPRGLEPVRGVADPEPVERELVEPVETASGFRLSCGSGRDLSY